MAKGTANLARSIKDRLLNLSRSEGRVFDVVLVRFALERLLYRLSQTHHRDRFVLKGGLLVTIWLEDDNRVTRDADFLGHGDASAAQLIADFREIMSVDAEDGLRFDVDALTATAIREELEYGGTRLRTTAYLERTRIPITIDIGFGDALADATKELDYPTLLDLPAPHVRAYPAETVIAEKFQAMVNLGILNGRMKDYYDLWALPRTLTIADDALDAAIAATFERRRTAIAGSAARTRRNGRGTSSAAARERGVRRHASDRHRMAETRHGARRRPRPSGRSRARSHPGARRRHQPDRATSSPAG